jgi:hypothetical protein
MGWSLPVHRVVLVAAALVACAMALTAQAGAHEEIPCRPGPGTTTIAHSKHARIFEDHRNQNDYACLYSNGHARLLSPSEHYGYPIVRFAGPYVAFVPTTRSAREGSVWVMDLRSGHKHSYVEVQPTAENGICGEAVSLVLKSDGAVAWTARNYLEGCPMAPPATVEVRVHDSHGLRVLESAAGIVPTSLHISGSTLSWLNGASTRTATIY